MSRRRHTAEEMEAFFDSSETAQVFARDNRSGDLVFLARGQAAAMREETKAHFQCPIPDCPAPQLTTRGRTRRDHFAHLSSSGHPGARESLLHFHAKHLLGQWANQKAQQAGLSLAVAVDDAFIRTADRHRKPDVLVERPGGRRLVFEVECFNSTTTDSLAARRGHYRNAGVTDVWIFGHASKHVRMPPPSRYAPEGHVLITDLPGAIADAGQPILVLNPTDETVGTLVHDNPPAGPNWWKHPDRYGLVLATRHGLHGTAEMRIDPLAECDLDPFRGIITPTMRAVDASREHVRRLAEEERERARDAARREQAERRRLAQEKAAKKVAREERDKRAIAYRNEHAKVWENHPLRAQILAHYGHIPDCIAAERKSDSGIFAHPAHWHAVVFEAMVLRKEVGDTYTLDAIYQALREHGINTHRNPRFRETAVVGYVASLVLTGHLAMGEGTWATMPITVLANHLTAPDADTEAPSSDATPQKRNEPAPSQAESPRTALPNPTSTGQGDDRLGTQHTAGHASRVPLSRRRTPTGDSTGPGRRSTLGDSGLRCTTCGSRLDPSLASLGRHILC